MIVVTSYNQTKKSIAHALAQATISSPVAFSCKPKSHHFTVLTLAYPNRESPEYPIKTTMRSAGDAKMYRRDDSAPRRLVDICQQGEDGSIVTLAASFV